MSIIAHFVEKINYLNEVFNLWHDKELLKLLVSSTKTIKAP